MIHRFFWAVFATLMVLHHDCWFWEDGRLLFGFLPVGLGYHILISAAAGALWSWAVFGVWPEVFEDPPDEKQQTAAKAD